MNTQGKGEAVARPVKKTSLKSTNFWTGIATIVAAGFGYFSIYAELGAAEALSAEAGKAVEAIETKNYFALISVAINAGNILYHIFIKK